MPKCIIDGKEVEFQPGQNLVDVAKEAGIEIPIFCYHPGLSVVAQCRMCHVEIEKFGKLQTACSTKAAEGMVVRTKSEAVKKSQASVMEFLLINHPLDCPICDKSGECDLQDNSFEHGNAYMRYTEERRTYLDLDMGPVIQKNMNRCIHCTRCIRFGDEVAKIHEMVALKRGNNTEITTLDGRALETDYAGNYSDICPTGSLTLKDFRFHKRAWMLKKTPSTCEACSRGCNIELQQDHNRIYRTVPRHNEEVNQHWMCDEGRFHYHSVHDEARVIEPYIGNQPAEWSDAIVSARQALSGKKVSVLVGSDLTLEELALLKQFALSFGAGAELTHFGTPGVLSTKDDGAEDALLRRKSKTSNLNGVEKLGIPAFKELSSGVQAVLIVRGGRAVVPALPASTLKVGVGVFLSQEAEAFQAVLPGTTFAEKDGSIVNYQGKEQKFQRSILPVGKSKQLSEILMLWANTQTKSGAA